MAKPRYVRLRTDLRGRYDLRSGWGISGLDVKPMPDKDNEPNSHAFVTRELAVGRLEGASRAEYDEVHTDLAAASSEDEQFQERTLREQARVQHNKILKSRGAASESAEAEADEERRQAILNRRSEVSGSRAVAEDDDSDEDTDDDSADEGADDDSDDDDVDDDDVYDGMNKSALQDEAERRNLPKSGSADALRARLREADAADQS